MPALTVEGNTILSSVVRAIHKAYPEITIYKELVEQGIKYPNFQILCEDFDERKLMRENYLQTFVISVLYQYKEPPGTSYFHSNDMGYEVTQILRKITLPNGDKLRGDNINTYPERGKLAIFVNYTIKVASEQAEVPKQMSQTVNVYKK